jgi:hypothetical protein
VKFEAIVLGITVAAVWTLAAITGELNIGWILAGIILFLLLLAVCRLSNHFAGKFNEWAERQSGNTKE